MPLRQIGQVRNDQTQEILTELSRLNQAGQLTGLAYIAQIQGSPVPKFGALGRFDSDPYAGLAIIERMRMRLSMKAYHQELELDAQRTG